MISKENLNEQLALLDKRRKVLQETIDSFQSGYSLPGHLEISFLNAELNDLYERLCKLNEAACVPLLKQELVAVHNEIVTITKKL
jgi:hypothetical protein